MVAVPISSQSVYPYPAAGSASLPAPATQPKVDDWTTLVAAGTVLAGGALMLAGHRKAGLAVAAVGTVVALLEEPGAVESWWENIPSYLNGAQEMLDKVEGYLNEASVQGHRIQSILRK
jgi:hypothetical protein